MNVGNQQVDQYLRDLAARSSTPGGGAVAALTGAQAVALISMVVEFSDKTIPEHQRTTLLEVAAQAREQFIVLADQDAQNFAALMTAYKTKTGIQQALEAAATPPLKCLELSVEMKSSLGVLSKAGNPNLITDTGIAAALLRSTIEASLMNVLINLRSIKNQTFISNAKRTMSEAQQYIAELDRLAQSITNELT